MATSDFTTLLPNLGIAKIGLGPVTTDSRPNPTDLDSGNAGDLLVSGGPGGTDSWEPSSSAVTAAITLIGDVEGSGVSPIVTTITDSAVTTVKIADNAVSTAKLQDGSVTTGKIADSSVTAIKLAPNSVTTVKILDSSVTSAKIADLAVLEAKLAAGSVTTTKLGDSSVTAIKIADGAVTSSKFADSSVTTAKIADGSVTTAKLADSSVTAIKIADLNITTAKLANNAVTNTKAAQMAASTIKGNNTAGVSDPIDLTVAQTKTLLNLTGTNSGDVTLGSFGTTPNANGASLSGQILTLQPASITQPGGISTTTQSFLGAKTFSTQLIGAGTATNDSAASGIIGEYIEATTVATPVSVVNNTAKTILSISLTAGDWDVQGTLVFEPNASSPVTQNILSYSKTTNAIGGSNAGVPVSGEIYVVNDENRTGLVSTIVGPRVRVSLASTTTIYLIARCRFTVSTMAVEGSISARRVR